MSEEAKACHLFTSVWTVLSVTVVVTVPHSSTMSPVCLKLRTMVLSSSTLCLWVRVCRMSFLPDFS